LKMGEKIDFSICQWEKNGKLSNFDSITHRGNLLINMRLLISCCPFSVSCLNCLITLEKTYGNYQNTQNERR